VAISFIILVSPSRGFGRCDGSLEKFSVSTGKVVAQTEEDQKRAQLENNLKSNHPKSRSNLNQAMSHPKTTQNQHELAAEDMDQDLRSPQVDVGSNTPDPPKTITIPQSSHHHQKLTTIQKTPRTFQLPTPTTTLSISNSNDHPPPR
jgi:hypothetical protein